MGATFNETRALTSVKYLTEEGINVPNFLEIYELILLHFCALSFKNTINHDNF